MTHEVEENWFVDICDDIIFRLDNNEFYYTNSMNYNKLIAKIFSDLIQHTISYNNQESNPHRFFDYYNKDEQVAFEVIKSLLKDSNELINFDLTNSKNITFLEKYFNEITSRLSSNIDYSLVSVSSDFNTKHKKMITTNDKMLDNLDLIIRQQNQIDSQNRLLCQKELHSKDRIEHNHYRVFDMLANADFKTWKDTNNKLFYRLKAFEQEQKINKDELGDIISGIIGFNVTIYACKNDITVINADYLITSLLPTVRKEIFNPFVHNEFIHISNNLYDRNSFEYTPLLNKRFLTENAHYQNSFIEKFLKLIFQNEREFFCFFDWLTNFFYHLHKSNTVLVLIGDKETTDILMNNLIKPMFIKNKKYLCSVSNSSLEKHSNDENLLENKIFYHFDNLNEKVDTKRLIKLIRSIVKPNIITPSQAWDEDEPYVYGEILVTASKESPYSYLKDVFSACSVLRVKDMAFILKKLNMDYLSFEKAFINDLENFIDRLLENAKNNYAVDVLDNDEKNYLKNMKNGVLVTPKIDRKIDCFINDIQRANNYAFTCIKNYDEEIYEEFIHNFNEKMIAQPMLNKYFNIYYGYEIILDNNEFIKILQTKEKMFNEKLHDKSKQNGKKRYEIF